MYSILLIFLLAILHFLCLSSATFGLQLAPPLNIKTPLGLDLGIGEINADIFSPINSKTNSPVPQNQCFCIPNNENSRPVTSHLDVHNEDLERKVVYLYKTNGLVKVYIPNRRKQELIPDLNFDEHEGDIIIPVSSESIVQLFDPNLIDHQDVVVTITEEITNEIETIEVETNEPHTVNVNTDSNELLIENIDHSPIVPTQNNSPLDDQVISIDNLLKPSVHGEEINSPEINVIVNSPDANQLNQITPILPSKPQNINPDTTSNNHESHISPDQNGSDPLYIIKTMLPPKSPTPDNPGDVKKPGLDKTSEIDEYGQLQQIISLLPFNSQSHSNPLQQNTYPMDSSVNNYATFYDWYQAQLKHVVLYNLETPFKINELRERIIKVLLDNGMHLSMKGIVTDSNGNLVRMNNIKLRPILIGGQVDAQNFLGHDTNIAETAVSYVQFLEIIQVSPPKLLGTLVMGTVYLPRNVHVAQTTSLWDNNQVDMSPIQRQFGCTTCKPPKFSKVQDTVRVSPIPTPYGQYYGLPFRRNFGTGKQILMNQVPYKKPEIASIEPKRRISSSVNRSGLGGIFEGLLENLGITPTIVSTPNRRLLGGVVPKVTKPGPRAYPNDVLPGFRIIGGNAATSSGTPLANKGRSGFVKPSLII